MIDRLKNIVKHSFVYGISSMATKASGVILLPLYTEYFSVDEYGRLGLILITVQILFQTIILGQNQAVVRYNNLPEYRDKKESAFFTISGFITLFLTVFTVAGLALVNYISQFTGNPGEYRSLLTISVFLIFSMALNNIFLNKLRAEEKSGLYTIISVVKIVILILLTVYLILAGEGITAVLYGMLASEALTTVMILPAMIKEMSFKWEGAILKDSLKFGIPLIFSILSMSLLNSSDRYIIKYFHSDAVIGWYELGYRIAGIINMFIIMPFTLTLLPSAYKIYKEKDDKRYYSKLLTYFTFILVWSALAISLFGKEIVMLFSMDDSFYRAAEVVPLISFSYIFAGMLLVAILGMYLTGKTKLVAFVTLIAALLNIGLNFIFVPGLDMIGAAYTTIAAFIFLYVASVYASNKCYYIPFEHGKTVYFIATGILFYLVVYIIPEVHIGYVIAAKLTVTAVFPLILFFPGILEQGEKETLSKIMIALKEPKKLSVLIKEELLKNKR